MLNTERTNESAAYGESFYGSIYGIYKNKDCQHSSISNDLN